MRIITAFAFLFSILCFADQDRADGLMLRLKEGTGFTASIGHTIPQVRMWLKLDQDNKVIGLYRYKKSSCSLRLNGEFKGLSLKLVEKDCKGQLSGEFELLLNKDLNTFSGHFHAKARRKKLPVSLMVSDWIWLGDWKWISPARLDNHPNDRCSSTHRWPQFWGLSAPARIKLEKRFAPPKVLADDSEFCSEAMQIFPISTSAQYERQNDFSILGMRGDALSILMTSYQFSGGAHGSTVQTCAVFDLISGDEIKVTNLLDSNKKQALRTIVERELIRSFGKPGTKEPQTLETAGIWRESFDKAIQAPQICLNAYGLGGYVLFQQYEIAPYSMGMPQASLSEQELSDVLLKHEQTQRLLGYKFN